MKYILLLLLATSLMSAQDIVQDTFPTQVLPNEIDVLSYDLHLDLVKCFHTQRAKRGRRKIESSANITLKLNVPSDQVALDIYDLLVDSVTVDNVPIDADIDTPWKLTIRFPTMLDTGVVHVVHIRYAIMHDDRGIIVIDPEDGSPDPFVGPNPYTQVCTFTMPSLAHAWFPCHNTSSDKAFYSVSVRTPAGISSTSNGTRLEDLSDTDTTHIERWQLDAPMSPSLVSLTASNYAVYQKVHRRSESDSVIITTYLWEEDLKSTWIDVDSTFKDQPRMMAMLERYFGPYPYATYGNTVLALSRFGSVEHTSLTSISRYYLRGAFPQVVVHDLALQWFGDLVTEATWADRWMTVGMGSISEAMWNEEANGVGGYAEWMNNFRASYLNGSYNAFAVYDIPVSYWFEADVLYPKSAWVYHMMRQMVGDERFFGGMRTWLETRAHTSAQTADFVEFWKEYHPDPLVDWDTFFYQWLVQRGHPTLTINTAKTDLFNGQYGYTIVVNQTQPTENAPKPFVFPLRIRIIHADSVFEDRVVINERSQILHYDALLDGRIEIDPLNEVLLVVDTMVTTHVHTSVQATTPTLTIIGAQPHVRTEQLQVSCSGAGRQGQIRIINMSGTIVQHSTLTPATEIISIDTIDLAPGVYALQWIVGETVSTTMCAVVE